MSHTDYFRRPSGQILYAKPLPLVVAAWAVDTIVATENASTGSYAFTGLADDRDYEIFRQLGSAPADSDTAIGALTKPVDTSGIDLLLDRVTGLTGPLVVASTVVDELGHAVQQARVRLSKLGDTQTKLTDANGLAQFTCEAGVWNVAITATGFSSQLNTLNVSDDTQVSYTLFAIAVSVPLNPQLCAVQIFAKHNGVVLQGAVCKARLKSFNSAIDGTVLSTQITESVTDAEGYAELQLIRAAQFVDGDGQYVIEVWHEERRFVAVTVTIPDQNEVNLEDLIPDGV